MSSYFSIKLREKKTDKILSLNCWSRNNAVYQLFVNNISVPYADCPERDEHGDFKYDKNGCIIYKPTLYHKLTSEDFKTVLEEADKEIKFYKDLLVGIKDKQTFNQALQFQKGAIIGSEFIKFLKENSIDRIHTFVNCFC